MAPNKFTRVKSVEDVEELKTDAASSGIRTKFQSSMSPDFHRNNTFTKSGSLIDATDHNQSNTSSDHTLQNNSASSSGRSDASVPIGGASCESNVVPRVTPSSASSSSLLQEERSGRPSNTSPQLPQNAVARNTLKRWNSFESLKREDMRLLTFAGWPLGFIKPQDLANSGFFYLKKGDRVQCAFCRGIVGDWEPGDQPMSEHKRHFPNCPFVCGLPVGNIDSGQNEDDLVEEQRFQQNCDTCQRYMDEVRPYSVVERTGQDLLQHVNFKGMPYKNSGLLSLGINQYSGPCNEYYRSMEQRIRSFDGWPVSLKQKPGELAEAGFYYVGLSDHVKCFHCNGGLRNWEPDDDPWVEHARWFFKCPFVLMVKGEEFVKKIVTENPPELPAQTPKPSAPALETVTERSTDSEIYSRTSSSRNRAALINQFIQMGFDRMLIERVLVEVLDNQDVAVEEVLDTLLRYTSQKREEQPQTQRVVPAEKCEQKQNGASVSTEETEAAATEERFSVKKSVEIDQNGIHTSETGGLQPKVNSAASTQSHTTGTLEEENERLKQVHTCKVCMDEEIGVVFLPCGHFVTCVKCAPAFSSCPLCRKEIQGTVRTFLS